MKNKKSGRPSFPKGTAKREVITLKASKEEVAQIEQAAQRAGQPKSELIRETALVAAEQWARPALASDLFWGPLPYPIEELDRKSIEFKLVVKYPENSNLILASGLGTMRIRKRPGGFHVRILAPYSDKREKVIDLDAEQAKRITRQPEGGKADFYLEAVPL